MAGSQVVSSVFYGYPAELVAEWCGVSVRTAERWKRGERKPSTSAVKLFELHRSRRVLGVEWNGWIVKDDLLVDPEGNETTQGQLRAYYLVYQLCRELMRDDPDAQASFERILRAEAFALFPSHSTSACLSDTRLSIDATEGSSPMASASKRSVTVGGCSESASHRTSFANYGGIRVQIISY